jgi:hypothetical protein
MCLIALSLMKFLDICEKGQTNVPCYALYACNVHNCNEDVQHATGAMA